MSSNRSSSAAGAGAGRSLARPGFVHGIAADRWPRLQRTTTGWARLIRFCVDPAPGAARGIFPGSAVVAFPSEQPIQVEAQQLIERREYKYLVPEALVPGLREAIAPFCTLDDHAAREPAHQYPIESLYFDTPSLTFFWANQRTQVDRFKLRVRHYPSVEGGAVFLEVKRRCNDVILKTRGKVPRALWVDLLAEPSALGKVASTSRSALERFLFLLGTYNACPVMLVNYQREAWVSQIDDYARVTFDRRICSQPQERLSLESDPRGWRSMDHPVMQRAVASMVVVELKFTSRVPLWMMSVVQGFDLLRQSFSKYGTSIRTWHLAQPLRLTPHARGVAV